MDWTNLLGQINYLPSAQSKSMDWIDLLGEISFLPSVRVQSMVLTNLMHGQISYLP